MYILVISVVSGALFLGLVLVLTKYFERKKQGAGVSGSIAEMEDKITRLSTNIDSALDYCEQMIPYSQMKDREDEIATLNRQLNEEREKLEKLDKQVEKLQASIETEETAHNELKKGKEDAVELAEQVRSNRDRLADESKRLEEELKRSLTELEALSNEVELTSDQKIGFEKVQSALDNARLQLSTLADVYSQASGRFINLETQYHELEKEFTKLVEKELGGEA